jgi:16S rRNA (adenine1518-N6/adenine1519-N6)-dimethyltransferase
MHPLVAPVEIEPIPGPVLSHGPRKFLGQNFLIDADVVQRSLAMAEVAAGDRIVEVGPGFGALTEQLLGRGALVHGVEVDRELFKFLQRGLQGRYPGQFFPVLGDAVIFPRAELTSSQALDYKVVANLPYAISTPWLAALMEGPLPKSMTLLLQKEAAERLLAPAKSKKRSAIGVRIEGAFAFAASHPVSSHCFFPRPRVESLLIHVRRREQPFLFSEETYAVLRHCFNFRRKQLRGVIGTLGNPHVRMEMGKWFESLCAEGMDPHVRAEEMELDQWKFLEKSLESGRLRRDRDLSPAG